jgi:hypothetical protein
VNGGAPSDDPAARRKARRDTEQQGAVAASEELRKRSLWYVIGGSLVFEGVVLGLATLIFVRRDF